MMGDSVATRKVPVMSLNRTNPKATVYLGETGSISALPNCRQLKITSGLPWFWSHPDRCRRADLCRV